jgi:hypothetical protein
MKKRCAGLVVVLLSLFAFGIGNPYENFGGVIQPGLMVTRVDSVELLSPDMAFLTPGWGSETPEDTFVFTVGFPPWPETIKLYGSISGFPAYLTAVNPKLDTWYHLGMTPEAPHVKFCACPGEPDPGVEGSKPAVAQPPRLTVRPSVVTGQMTVRLQHVRTGRSVVEIHDAVGNVVRSLDCTAIADGAATATWNRKDTYGRIVPEGVYFCRYVASDVIAVRKVLVAR